MTKANQICLVTLPRLSSAGLFGQAAVFYPFWHCENGHFCKTFSDTPRRRGGASRYAKGGGAVGRPRKYTRKTLERALDAYFRGITRTVTIREQVDTGKKDRWGHSVYSLEDVKNDDGETVKVRQFVTPPTVGGLCEALSIHRSTWANYCDPKKHPELAEVTAWALDAMHHYLEDVPPGTVRRWKCVYKWDEILEMDPQGVCMMAETSLQRTKLVRDLCRSGWRQSDIAGVLGVSPKTVWRWKSDFNCQQAEKLRKYNRSYYEKRSYRRL